jgi:sugar phosphate isomerase/epimerase
MSTLSERIGVDLGGRRRLEDGLAWAAANGVHYVDMCLEGAPDHPNAPATWTPERVAAMRAMCERHRIQLGLHSASAVNVAETSPLLADAADQYLKTYIELAGRLGAGWIVVHGGYHFTGDYAARRAASLERLQRAAAHADRARALGVSGRAL